MDMSYLDINGRFGRLFRVGIYSAVALSTVSYGLTATPVNAHATEYKSKTPIIQPVVGHLEAPEYDWSAVVKPVRAKAKIELKLAPKPKPKPAPAPKPVVQEMPAPLNSTAQAQQAAPTTPVVPIAPGTAQAIGHDAVIARGWSEADAQCLVNLWNRESGWNPAASNGASGAYGIPQALPGSKMASAGADWATNPATQIKWGLDYIAGRYGTPCGAWDHSNSVGWY